MIDNIVWQPLETVLDRLMANLARWGCKSFSLIRDVVLDKYICPLGQLTRTTTVDWSFCRYKTILTSMRHHAWSWQPMDPGTLSIDHLLGLTSVIQSNTQYIYIRRTAYVSSYFWLFLIHHLICPMNVPTYLVSLHYFQLVFLLLRWKQSPFVIAIKTVQLRF